MSSERYKKGWENLKKIDEEAAKKVINTLQDVAPDLGNMSLNLLMVTFLTVRVWI